MFLRRPPQSRGLASSVRRQCRSASSNGCCSGSARCLALNLPGLTDDIPLNGNGSHQPIAIEGRPVVAMSEQPEVDVRLISPGYMSAMRIPIVIAAIS